MEGGALDLGGGWALVVLMHGVHAPRAAAFEVHFELALSRPADLTASTLSGGISLLFGPLRQLESQEQLRRQDGLRVHFHPVDGVCAVPVKPKTSIRPTISVKPKTSIRPTTSVKPKTSTRPTTSVRFHPW